MRQDRSPWNKTCVTLKVGSCFESKIAPAGEQDVFLIDPLPGGQTSLMNKVE